MTCSRCGNDIPEGTRFCPKCGLPVSAGAPHPAARSGPPRWLLPAILGAIALAAIGYIAWSNLMGRGSRVVQAPATPPPAAPLTDRSARVQPTAPLTDAPATREPVRTDIMDYLRWVRQVEGERVSLSKTQMGQVLAWSSRITASNLQAEMSEDPDAGHRQTYTDFQNEVERWQRDWQTLSARFVDGYGKPVPAECAALRDLYFEVMKTTAAAMTQVGTSLAQGLSGNPQAALEQLTSMRGSASASVDKACADADQELGDVCSKFNLRKEFDIKSDGGMSNPFGAGL